MAKRLLSLITAVTGLMFLLASTANAATSVHTNFAANSGFCAVCHVTHAANGPFLIVKNTETELCYSCHGNGMSGSDLNVESGVDEVGIDTPSSAGGFTTFNGQPVTSKHDLGNSAPIPGGGTGITGGLQCVSCHNPHGTTNSRLLQTKVNGVDVSGVHVELTTNAENLVTAYVYGFTQWCSACHPRFETTAGSGHTADSFSMYRHATEVTVSTVYGGTPIGDFSITAGTPLQGTKISCLTCHRAHGTSVTMTGYAATSGWKREDSSAGNGSALLRRKNRGVCFNCHGLARYNVPGA